jgi:RHS repeat-associated protein
LNGSRKLQLGYGVVLKTTPSRRQKAEYKEGGDLKLVRHYAGSCEFDDNKVTGDKRKVYYIDNGNEPVALYEKKNGTGNFYYICSDALGSIEIITDQNRIKIMDVGYDALGNRRDHVSWALTKNPGTYFIDRGYTGHEHIDKLGVINMNGRMYDPAIGLFLSPDIIIQNPDLSINYNRYSYTLNNPLKYIDPSGWYYESNLYDPDAQGAYSPENYYDYSDYSYSIGDGYWDNIRHIKEWKKNEYNLNPKTGEYENVFGEKLETSRNYTYITMFYKASKELILIYDKNGNLKLFIFPGEPYTAGMKVPLIVPDGFTAAGGGDEFGGYEALSHGGHITHIVAGGYEAAISATLKDIRQTVKLVGTEAEVAKLIGNIGRVAKGAGYVGEGIVVLANGYNVYTNPTAENWARAGVSSLAIGVNALNFIVPGLGLGLSIGITAIDAAGGFNWFYDAMK